MEFNATIGCSVCGYQKQQNILLPYNCDDYICAKCASINSLSIISIGDATSVNDVVLSKPCNAYQN